MTSLIARILVGTPLCIDVTYLNALKSYATIIFISASILKLFPPALRPLIKYAIPYIRRIHQYNAISAGHVKRILSKEWGEQTTSAVMLINEMLPEELKKDYLFQGKGQLGLGAAGIHTTARLLTNCIYDLAAHPEWISVLREEIEKVGGVDPEWDMAKLGRLWKLDSFIREVLRLEGNGISTFPFTSISF